MMNLCKLEMSLSLLEMLQQHSWSSAIPSTPFLQFAVAHVCASSNTQTSLDRILTSPAKCELVHADLSVADWMEELSISNGQLEELSISNGQLEELSISSGQLEELSISNGQLEELSISNGQLEELSISDGQLEELSISDVQ